MRAWCGAVREQELQGRRGREHVKNENVQDSKITDYGRVGIPTLGILGYGIVVRLETRMGTVNCVQKSQHTHPLCCTQTKQSKLHINSQV